MNIYDSSIKLLKLKITSLYEEIEEIYTLDISNQEKYLSKIILKDKITQLKKELKEIYSNNKYPHYINASKDKITFKDFFKEKFKNETSYHLKYAWGRFVYQILKNPFVKTHKLTQQKGKCSYCNTDINKEVYILHHKTYNYLCMNEKTIDTNDNSQYPIIPDCKSCLKNSPNRFNDCMSKIDYLHQSCHDKVHDLKQ